MGRLAWLRALRGATTSDVG